MSVREGASSKKEKKPGPPLMRVLTFDLKKKLKEEVSGSLMLGVPAQDFIFVKEFH